MTINLMDHVGSETGDVTTQVNAAADAARAAGVGLTMPTGATIQIDGTVNLRSIFYLDLDGTIKVGPSGMVITGGVRTKRDGARIRLREVLHLDPATQTNVALRTVGLKGAEVSVGRCDYWQWWADPTNHLDQSCSYNTVTAGTIRKLEFYCRKGTTEGMFGWITELTFIGGDYRHITVDSDYIINQITFLKPCCEGGEVHIPIGHRWSFIDARGEGGTELWFGPDSSRIVWEDQYVSNPLAVKPDVVVMQDDGVENIVTTSFERHYQRRSLAVIDTETRLFDASSNLAVTNLAPGLERLTPTRTFGQILDTGLIPVRGSGVDEVTAYGSQWFMPRISASSDAASFRYNLYCYGADRALIDPGDGLVIGGGASWDSTSQSWRVLSNVPTMSATVRGQTVAYMRLVLSTGNPITPFSRIEITGWLTGASSDYPVDLVRRRLTAHTRQATRPTRGIGPVGTQVQGEDKGWNITARADTTATAAASGETSVTVASTHGIAVGDMIGIATSDQSTHWATISAISGTALTLSRPLPAAVSNGARIATARWQ